jgi:ADP-ribose pyrophosphatase YjhB (NUDIX family)
MTASLPSKPVVGVGALVWKGDRILLVRRGHPPRAGSWSLPGGRQEWGETVAEGAAREVFEETGVRIRVVDVLAVVDLIDRDETGQAYHFTVIDVLALWTGGDAVAGDDADAVAWVEPAALASYHLTAAVLEVVALALERRNTPTRRPALLCHTPAVRPTDEKSCHVGPRFV